jgi:hypothetical protein
MRFSLGMLACLGVTAVKLAIASDPPAAPPSSPASQAAQSAPATRATNPAPVPPTAPAEPGAASRDAAAAARAAAAKAALDKDARHFLALGYRPEMRGGEQIYCRKETALGSRLTQVKNCATLAQLRLSEQEAKSNLSNVQRRGHGDCVYSGGKTANCGN